MGISREQALDCFRSNDLIGIGMEADAVRRKLHPEGVVTYAIGAFVDLSEVLLAARDNAEPEAALERLCGAIDRAVELDATGMRLTGAIGVKSEVGLQWFEGMLRELRRRYPAMRIEGLSASDVSGIASRCDMALNDLLGRLQSAGLDAILGDGPLDKRNLDEWIAVQRAAHKLGMRTAAAMVFGEGDTPEQRVDFLDAVRRLQEETGGFAEFVPVAAPAANGRELDEATAVERLKTLAIARMFLENVENMQAVRAGHGLKVLQTGLRFGANDAGMISGEGASEEDVRRVIRDAGFKPAQRDAAYRALFLI